MRGVTKWSLGAIGVLGALLWLGGCAGKSDQQIYRQLQAHREDFTMLQQSQKIFFRHGEGNTTVVIASYLPHSSSESEVFILSVYPPGEIRLSRVRLAEAFPKLTQTRWIALRLLEGDRQVIEAVATGEIGTLAEQPESQNSEPGA